MSEFGFDVVALGELLVDFACVARNRDGYPSLDAHPGGAPANFLAAVQKFGGRTALIGKVGTDAFGDMLVNTLDDAGIDRRGIARTDSAFTTLAFVTFSPSGDRRFSFSRKPGADTCLGVSDVDRSLIQSARVFHFGTLSLTGSPVREATRFAVSVAKEEGKIVSCDPNLRKMLWDDLKDARQQMLWALEQADIVKISEEEVAFLFGTISPEDAARRILDEYGAKLVYVTLGNRGCLYANRIAVGRMPAIGEGPATDTTGAGDIFGGSAMWALLQTGKAPDTLEKRELEKIVGFASASAGLSVLRPGGISSIPKLDDVRKLLEENCNG